MERGYTQRLMETGHRVQLQVQLGARRDRASTGSRRVAADLDKHEDGLIDARDNTSVIEADGDPVAALCGFGDTSVYAASSAAIAEASGKMGITKSEQAELCLQNLQQ
ncbi:MAG TPA: hypothetical protein VGL53_25415 [Bryobacteraceae bacterium]|jgi:hypothetical protein